MLATATGSQSRVQNLILKKQGTVAYLRSIFSSKSFRGCFTFFSFTMRQLHFFTVLIALTLSPLAALADPVSDDINNAITGINFTLPHCTAPDSIRLTEFNSIDFV